MGSSGCGLEMRNFTSILFATVFAAVLAPAALAQHKLVYNEHGTFGHQDTPSQP